MTELAPADPRLVGLPPLQGGAALVLAAHDWAASMALAADYAHVVALELPEWGPAPLPPLTTGSVDLVVLAGVLRLVASPTPLLEGAVARLRPGGLLLIAEPMRAQASPGATRHLDALDLGAAIARARGGFQTPAFQRLQVGSVIQGLDLVDLGFSPAVPADDAAPAARREARDAWRARFAEAAEDAALPADLRARARAADLEDLALAPAMRVWGRRPS